MIEIIDKKPFRINFKNKDKTIYAVIDGILCIFFRNDWGWLNVPDEMYNRCWSFVRNKGITYIPDEELERLSREFTNGEDLLL
ncbi:hypothetical protein CYK11_07735 [Streptococcus anginosus]|uniref:Phage protein n=1 Tax=Streptococcus anginosus TaxID=1328 RepID=A0ABT3EAL9_STRAP|nr:MULTISPECIES: hypothetical protein [Streptococcus]HEP3392647.1 hypothetical protein [Streptococcus pyogenes]KAA9252150.1 hypothetical protein F6I28_10090 [Streptococcus anginosus]KAA9291752.1 hypothetical protein F6I05_07980 [Streptococcus anginosus]KAA9308703.1 hypothetical protein F6H99_08615 [Streptococcus anginosus]MCW1042491.1 hypothetical protein [Streptococcus anginosus]